MPTAASLLLAVLVTAEGFPDISQSSVDETRGRELREFTLVPPYSNVDNWGLFGDVFISRNYIRLTSDEPSLTGSLWSPDGLNARDWEIQAHFHLSSSGDIPADGLAIWYADTPGDGPAWGAPSVFHGVGVVLDTFVNEERENSGQSVRLFILINHHALNTEVDVGTDGSNLKILPECKLGSELIFSREPTTDESTATLMILVRYVSETIQVFYSIPRNNNHFWTHCTNASRGEIKGSAVGDLWAAVHVVVVVVLVLGVVYGLYTVTDRFIDDNFIMARPRKRFY
ncbi:unnamed protein product [Heligmosomoides polygyrus]|uniref:L-type lectin-like domain-containing protein n=1 Tax=Heligmosomoides polygyrus TaxID=6339 RepID=A0A183G1S3_HELPZ|nr:unnamed protein product [Heligmosomoides polygyrus]